MARRSMLLRPFVLFLVAVSGTAVAAQLPGDARAAVGVYRTALSTAKAGRTSRAFETALSALADVRTALTRETETARGTILESLAAADFEQLRRDLEGVLVSRDETIYLEPDPEYFVSLAAAHGDAADRAFFAALKRTYPTGTWPLYLEQQTDSTGCTAFGNGILSRIHQLWFDVRRSYPDRYVKETSKELGRVTRELTDSTCACGNAASVQQELQQFLREVPSSPLRPAIERRLQQIRTGKSTVRFHCTSR